ncbi:MAG: hypothetical protein Q9195_006899 [Heterodermia aff. obscurata]
MDPNLIAARQRYRTPKPAPSAELSAFSKKLERNPFDFGLQKHPTTGKLWHLPKLALDAKVNVAGKGEDDPGQGDDGVSESQEVPTSLTSEATTQREIPLRTITGTYFAAQKSTLQVISRLERHEYKKVFPYRWKRGAIPNMKDIVWREDMDTYVLGLMRKDLMRELQYVSSRPSGYVTSSTYGQVRMHPQLGAALWLGAEDTEFSTSVEETGTDGKADVPRGSAGPPPYAMLDYRGRYIPVFNLQTLLGNKSLGHLKESRPVFQGEIAVIREKRNTVKVQMALWKLMGYLAG